MYYRFFFNHNMYVTIRFCYELFYFKAFQNANEQNVSSDSNGNKNNLDVA